MSENNFYSCDAHSWPKNMNLIAGGSMINGMNKKHFSKNLKSVKFRCFSGTAIDRWHEL